MPIQHVESLEALAGYAEFFVRQHPHGGVFGLQGDLGVGKTSFVREVVSFLYRRQGLLVPRVTSPSYVIHQQYETQPPVDHFDLYRMESPDEAALMEIGYLDAASERRGFVFVEWPERLPAEHKIADILQFEFEGSARKITY